MCNALVRPPNGRKMGSISRIDGGKIFGSAFMSIHERGPFMMTNPSEVLWSHVGIIAVDGGNKRLIGEFWRREKDSRDKTAELDQLGIDLNLRLGQVVSPRPIDRIIEATEVRHQCPALPNGTPLFARERLPGGSLELAPAKLVTCSCRCLTTIRVEAIGDRNSTSAEVTASLTYALV